EIADFRPQDHLDAKRAKRLDRFSQLAVTSARFALSDAALDPAREDRDRIGAMMGSALGGVAFAESQVERFRAEGPRGLDPALARGAKIYAELVGYAFTNDAYHMTAPRPDGRQAARAMQLALDDARVLPGDVGYINAHGSSTPLNDSTETLAIKQVFGDHAYRLCVSGTKGYYGHALG